MGRPIISLLRSVHPLHLYKHLSRELTNHSHSHSHLGTWVGDTYLYELEIEIQVVGGKPYLFGVRELARPIGAAFSY
jgi:hypothetical protein